MARLNKTGIDYFPFDVDFFQDEKVQFVSARFQLKGEITAIRLLCKIYRNGYYTEWNDDTALLFAKSVGDGVQDSFVKDVVHELLKRGFFDKGIFERFGILTSRGIQNRYFEATKRYKKVEVIGDFLLVDVSEMKNVYINSKNVYINSKNDDINSQKKREINKKEKEKEKEKEIEKMQFAEFVSMTNVEYQTLVTEHGEEATREFVKILDNYKGSSGKKYKSDYRAILTWVVGEFSKRKCSISNSNGGKNAVHDKSINIVNSLKSDKNGQ